MHLGAGVAMIVAGASFACVVMFGLWRRLSGPLALGLVGLSGAVAGAGGLLVQDDVGAASWVVTMFAFVVMTPVHARLVFGAPRTIRRRDGCRGGLRRVEKSRDP